MIHLIIPNQIKVKQSKAKQKRTEQKKAFLFLVLWSLGGSKIWLHIFKSPTAPINRAEKDHKYFYLILFYLELSLLLSYLNLLQNLILHDLLKSNSISDKKWLKIGSSWWKRKTWENVYSLILTNAEESHTFLTFLLTYVVEHPY